MAKAITALDCQRLTKGELSDPMCPGLRLVAGVQRRTWIYRYRALDGRLRQLKLGDYPAMGLAEVRRVWIAQRKIRTDPARGDSRAERDAALAQAVKRVEKAYTVGELLEDYATRHLAKLAKGHELKRVLDYDVNVKVR